VTEDRSRRVEIVLAHQGQAPVRFRFAPPGRGRAPVIHTDAYDVDAEADLAVPLDALTQLFGWLQAQLSAGLGAAPAPVLAQDAIERAMRPSALMRGRQRVALLATRLHNHFAVAGWRLEALRWPNETAAELSVRGPGGIGVDVCFTLGARGNRSQLGVDFRPASGSDPNGVKAVIDELVALLRGPQPPAELSAEPGALH
jgi:hypothetical protein